MTDQTKCPHCGAFERIRAGVNTGFICGTASIAGRTLRSIDCCIFELNNLKAKVAAQQELLQNIITCAASTGTQTVTAVIPFDLWEKLEASK